MKVVVWTVFPLWGGMWTRRYFCTLYRRQTVWWVGDARSAWWIFSDQYFWSFIHWRGNGIRKGYLWKRFHVCSLWGKEEVQYHRFSRPGSNWAAIREQYLSDQGAINRALAGNLLEIRSKVRNEWEVFILWHSVRMSWNSVDLCRKYTWYIQYGPTHIWIGPYIGWPGTSIGWPILSTLMDSLWNWTSHQHPQHYKERRWLVLFHQLPIHVDKIGQQIQGPIQRHFLPYCVTFYKLFWGYVCRLGTLWLC